MLFFNRRHEPEDREDLKSVLVAAHARKVIDDESLSMIAGTLDMANKTVADIMVP